MNNQEHIEQILIEATGQAHFLGYPRIYVDLTGDVKAAIFLNQCVYWSDKGVRADGYIFKSVKESVEELGLSVAEVKRIKKKLLQLGFIHTKVIRAYGAPTTHYLLDIPFLEKSIKQFCEKQKMDISETKDSDLVKIDKSITENTTDNTTQNTTETSSVESLSLLDSGKESLSSEEEGQGYTQHIDPDDFSAWKEESKFPGYILEASNVSSLTQEELERLYLIEANIYVGEIDAVGWDGEPLWSPDKYELKYVQDKLKFAQNKHEEGKSLKPLSIINMIEKPENKEKWRSFQPSKRR